jgi:hypothetical protein
VNIAQKPEPGIGSGAGPDVIAAEPDVLPAESRVTNRWCGRSKETRCSRSGLLIVESDVSSPNAH